MIHRKKETSSPLTAFVNIAVLISLSAWKSPTDTRLKFISTVCLTGYLNINVLPSARPQT